jgi:hypothetical protein
MIRASQQPCRTLASAPRYLALRPDSACYLLRAPNHPLSATLLKHRTRLCVHRRAVSAYQKLPPRLSFRP